MRVYAIPAVTAYDGTFTFSPDGRLLGLVDQSTRDVILLDTHRDTRHRIPDPFGAHRLSLAVGDGVALLPGGTGRVRVFDTATGAEREPLPIEGYPWAVAIGPDPEAATVQSMVAGKTIIGRYPVRTGEPLRPISKCAEKARGMLAYSGDGSRLAAVYTRAHDTTIRVWSVGPTPATRPVALVELAFDPHRSVQAVALSADGGWLAAAVGRATLVWEVRRPGPPREVGDAVRAGRAVVFHPTRPLLATVGSDRTVTVWGLGSPDPLRTFAWDIGELSAVAFSPDGLQAAAAGAGRVVIWDVD